MEPRFFIEGRHAGGADVTLAEEDARKIVTVLRMRSGDRVTLIDSASQQFEAILRIDGNTVRAELGQCRAAARSESRTMVSVAQAVPKGQKMDFVVEKLTELGVASIFPIYTERTIVNELGSNKLERWRRLAKTAAQQCGRAEVPRIYEPLTFRELPERFSGFDAVLLAWESARPIPLAALLPRLVARARRVLVVIGPEGGFSHAEAEAAQRAGAQLISLGERILRTETAGIVALVLIDFVTQRAV